MIVNTHFQPPSIPYPSDHTPTQHPGLNINKIFDLQGSYGQNKYDPCTNSSRKDPDPPLDKIQAQKHLKPQSKTRTIKSLHSTPRRSLWPRRMKQAPSPAKMLALGAGTARIRRTPGKIPLSRSLFTPGRNRS